MKISARTDLLMTTLAFLYLSIPVVIFLVFWTTPLVYVPVCALLCVAIFYALKDARRTSLFETPVFEIRKRTTLAALALIAGWVFLSGIGNYSYQLGDHYYRNAIFNDLQNLDWPIIFDYGTDKFFFVYYFIYWLPSALVAKLFGADIGHFALWLWTALGIFIALYHSEAALKRASVIAVIALILYGGFDLFPCLLRAFASDCKFREFNGVALFPESARGSLEYWKYLGWVFYVDYRGITDSLFTVFNQCVPAWIATALCLRKFSIWTKFLSGALLFCFAPFPFMGLGIYLLFKAAIDRVKGEPLSQIFASNLATPRRHIVSALLASVALGGVLALFFSMNGKGMGFFIFAGLPLDRFAAFYLTLVCVQFLFMAIFLFKILGNLRGEKASLAPLSAATLSLLFIPFFQIVEPMNFIMRAAIPATFVFAIYAGYALSSLRLSTVSKTCKRAFIAYCLLCATIPALQIARSAVKTAFTNDYLNEPNNSFTLPSRFNVHFCAENYTDKPFYKYLSPKDEK